MPGLTNTFARLYRTIVHMAVLFVLLGLSQIAQATPASASPRRPGEAATLLSDGRILVTGGCVSGRATNSVELMSPDNSNTSIKPGLLTAREGHTATALPDGTVLIVGGRDENGHYARTMEIFNPQDGLFTRWSGTPVVPRRGHTATLLTDGRVVIIGGVGEGGSTPNDIQMWDFHTGSIRSIDVVPLIPRQGHTASLLADGKVILSGGTDKSGQPIIQSELFDPERSTFQLLQTEPTADTGAVTLAESSPADGEASFEITDFIKLRFSALVDVTSISSSTVSLISSSGTEVPASVHSGEQGRLAFLLPSTSLSPGADYVLTLTGIDDLNGKAMASTTIRFHTAGDIDDGVDDGWVPDSAALDGNWNSRTGPSRWQNLPGLTAGRGMTAVSGQVLGLSGRPLSHVTLQIESNKTESDNTGRFLLKGISPGHKILIINGATADKAKAHYGFYEVAADIKGGVTTHLGYTIWMTKLDMAHAVTISSPTIGSDTVISTPLLPGLALHLPAGTTIVGRDGRAISQLTITPVPLDKPPFPLPTGLKVPLYFTIQPGGAEIRMASAGAHVLGAQLYYPNSYKEPANMPYNFWNYDPVSKGWYIYGAGKVTSDRTSIVPNPGVFVYELTGAMVGGAGPKPPVGAEGGGGTVGDPVDLASGQFVYEATDLVLPDILPIQLKRTYITNDHLQRPFGIGATDNYDVFMVGDNAPYTYQELILPNGTPIRFNRTSAGTNFTDAVYLSSSTAGPWYGATISYTTATSTPFVATQGWTLRTRSGTLYAFPIAFNANSQQTQALVGIQDRNGNTVTLTRNSNSVLTQIGSPNGRTISLTYDTQGRITRAIDNVGRTVAYTYDSAGHLATVTDVNGGVTTYAYDSNDLMTSITDARHTTYLVNQYDSYGRVIQQIQADGGIYSYQWTPSTNSSQQWTSTNGTMNRYNPAQSEGYTGLISQVNVTDPRGYVHQVTMNNLGMKNIDTIALGQQEQQSTSYQYYADNLLQAVTDALGRQTTFDYDGLGNLSRVTKLAGTSSAVTYTATYDQTYSNVLSATNPLNSTFTRTYDTLGNLIGTKDPLGHGVTITNDSNGRPTSVADAVGNAITLAYVAGDLAKVTDALGNQTSRLTDAAGRMTSLTDPLGNVTQYQYDNENRVSNITNALDQQAAFTYDPNGNLVTVQDFLSNKTQVGYDTMDRVVSSTDPLNRSSQSVYDMGGLLVSTVDRKGQTTSLSYDGVGRPISVGFGATTSGSLTTYQSTVANSYDAGNRLTSVTDSSYGTISRAWDGLDRLTAETTQQGNIAYTYDNAGRRSTASPSNAGSISYAYDNGSRLTGITQGSSQVALSYDSDNRRTSLTLPNGVVVTYGYDQDSRLNALSYSNSSGSIGNLAYGFDAAGRKTNITGSLAQTGLPVALGQAVYDAANELLSWDNASATYDANGSPLTDVSGRQYSWNTRNQLAGITGTWSATFQYDPFGRRSHSTISGVPTDFLYDLSNRVSETSGSSTSTLLSGGIDEYFQRSDRSGTSSPILDGLGSTVGVTNAAGLLTTQYFYDPYGNTTVSGNASGNTSQYTGRENDQTGLYFYRARYYSSQTGRFISEDPLGMRFGPNLYAYTYDDPIAYRDPSGNDPFSGAITGAVFGALGGVDQGWGSVIGGAIAGGVAGGFAGALLPPGPLTGAAAGAAGDLAGQELGNLLNGQSLGNLNGGEIAGSALGGATGGLLGQYLGGLAATAGLADPASDWGSNILGGNLGLVGSLLGGELGKPHCR